LGNRVRAGKKTAPSRSCRGYTLIELMAVIILLSIMLSFAIPRFEGSLLKPDSRKISRRLVMKVESLRQSAIKSRKLYSLHIQPDMGLIWETNESMTQEELDAAPHNAYKINADVRIRDVTFGSGRTISSGEAEIRFSPAGYSDKVLIHIEDENGKPITLLIEPFLPTVKIYDEDAGFER
jgi:prepilin-type N-terminal cleavage/methylation domain-containing protein